MNATDETPAKMMLLKDADWLDSYGRDLAEEGDADLEQTGLHLERIAERIRSALQSFPSVPDGYVLVPRLPTEAILGAWSYKWGEPNAANSWRDMLNAAMQQ